MDLRTALGNIHADRAWWRKVLICGALGLTVVGVPWPVGFVVESMDYARKGYPTPLPPLRDWSTRYVIGFLALLIDFVYFFLPIVAVGLVILCVILVFALSGSWGEPRGMLLSGIGALLLVYELAVFMMSVSPVGRIVYAREGRIEDALGLQTLREARSPLAQAEYRRARLRSLPAYVPAAALGLAAWYVTSSSLPGGPLVALLLLWLALSALFYAHLVVAQLYAAVARATG